MLFITTANSYSDPVPAALRDRMEVLEVPGYTEEEKLQIAREHLVDKQVKNHGLTDEMVTFTEEALRAVIRGYTREAGVRNLERENRLNLPQGRPPESGGQRERQIAITRETVVEMLGAPRFLDEEMEERTKNPGVAIGLAWTPVGGDVLFIEASRMNGAGAPDAHGIARRRHEGVGASRPVVDASPSLRNSASTRTSTRAQRFTCMCRPAPSRSDVGRRPASPWRLRLSRTGTELNWNGTVTVN